jgi:hypothetical protein
MRPAVQRPAIKQLFQAALLPSAAAAQAWRLVEPELDLDDPALAGVEVFALLSWRLPELGIDYPGLPRLVGVRRHNWVTSELAMTELAAQVSGRADRPVVVGRAATVAAYLPEPGLAPLGMAGLAEDVPGGTLAIIVKGVPVRVPAPAEHLVWAIERGQWLDAAFAARHLEMNWDAVTRIAVARGRPPRLHAGLVTLSELMGPSVPAEVLVAARPGRVRSLGSRLGEARLAAVHRVGQRVSGHPDRNDGRR